MPKAAVTFTSKDTGLAKLMQIVAAMKAGAGVKVGVLEESKAGSEVREGGLSNAQIAAIHEFGNNHVPERSFMRSTFNENRFKYVENLKTLIIRVLSGRLTIDQAFGIVGSKFAADVKKKITTGAGVPPPNAPSTIARKRAKGGWNGKQGRKGAIRTLIDTGRMVGSITWIVVRGK